MCHCVAQPVSTDVTKALQSFETLETAHWGAQHHISEDLCLQQHWCKNLRSHTAIFCTLLCLAQTRTILNSYLYLKVILFTHSPMLEHFVVKGRLQTSFCFAVCIPRILAAFLPLDPLFLCCCILFISPSYAASVCIVLQWFISLDSVFCASANVCSWILADFWALWRYSDHYCQADQLQPKVVFGNECDLYFTIQVLKY